jgi:lipopolysaccharide transport system ATP-binding protein
MCNDTIAIKVQNIDKKYILNKKIRDENGEETSEFWALKDISFEIKKGESVGIIGTNGSGKSTLLKILAGVTKPTCGNATLNGRVASILDIGAGFHPELSGKENIFLNGQLLGFAKKEIAAQYDKIVQYSGIEKFINQPVKNYSSGMYLRLAFSIMANLHFDIYLLDEVLNVGDANFQLKVKQFIQDNKNKSATFIFVSHDLNTLTANCSKFYLLDNGKIINEGNADIIEDYLYKSLVKSNGNQPINLYLNNQNPQLINDFVTIKEISVAQNEEGFVMEDEPLIEIKKPAKIDLAFGIENLLGNDICYVSTLISDVKLEDKNYQNEQVIVTAELPPFTVKKGKYILKLNLIVNDDNPIISQFKAFQFTIVKGVKKDCEMIDQRPNTAIIHGKWSFNKTF